MFEIELISYIKMDLALINLQRLICHKTQPTNHLFLSFFSFLESLFFLEQSHVKFLISPSFFPFCFFLSFYVDFFFVTFHFFICLLWLFLLFIFLLPYSLLLFLLLLYFLVFFSSFLFSFSLNDLLIFFGSFFPAAQSAGTVEYTDCISADGVKHPIKCVLDMTLKWIWWWGIGPGVLGNVEYTFIAITPRSTQLRRNSTY